MSWQLKGVMHCGVQVKQYREMADRLGSPAHLATLHWDAGARQYRDWGNHTEDVTLGWLQWQDEQGQLVHQELVRHLTGNPPKPQFVPHFGYRTFYGTTPFRPV